MYQNGVFSSRGAALCRWHHFRRHKRMPVSSGHPGLRRPHLSDELLKPLIASLLNPAVRNTALRSTPGSMAAVRSRRRRAQGRSARLRSCSRPQGALPVSWGDCLRRRPSAVPTIGTWRFINKGGNRQARYACLDSDVGGGTDGFCERPSLDGHRSLPRRARIDDGMRKVSCIYQRDQRDHHLMRSLICGIREKDQRCQNS